jgi:1-acyl-sn-glycerol-3-phosphate acyltransferase
MPDVDREKLLQRSLHKGVNPLVYWLTRAVLQPFFHLYFRLSRLGREHVPASGPVIIAANHRSFLDPFVIGVMARRPMYYVAKKELFRQRVVGWFLNALGAFPIDRGAADADAMATARAILERGDIVLIFPEGTRQRPGGLGTPKRGVARLALETGAPVVPIAVIGTEDVRRGWRVRPRKVRIRAGRPITFPRVESPSPQLAAAVTDRIWPCVMLQWEWLGGMAPLRRAAVIGAGSWGTGLAVALQRAGLDVQLGCRTPEQADDIRAAGRNAHYLPEVELDGVDVRCASDLDVSAADLVVLAVPARALPAVVAEHGARIDERAGVLVLSKGLVAPHAATPVEYVGAHVRARALACLGGPGHAGDAVHHGASLVIASQDRDFAAQLQRALVDARLDAHVSDDVLGVELASVAKNAAVLAAAAAQVTGPNAAGAAAGKVFSEVEGYARRQGARPETFAGLAGAGDLVATVVAAQSRNRRAGELLGRGVPRAEIEPQLGQAAEALDALPLLAQRLRAGRGRATTIGGLAGVVEGSVPFASWAASVTRPSDRSKRAA